MNGTPQLQGYELDQRLLEHPLAEIWRGRSFTGMEVVALILSENGAANSEVRDRLSQASRTAALEPGQEQTPLWAANLTATRPYAVTQLVPGQSGAERLLDPLDGLLGNDEESLGAVRSQLAQYGAVPIPITSHQEGQQTEQPQNAESEQQAEAIAETLGHSKLGIWGKLVAVLIVLAVFSILYSVGSKVGSETKEQRPAGPAPVAAVAPGPLPSPALLPGIVKPKPADYIPPLSAPSLVGATYDRGADVQQVAGLGLPFVFGWPRPPSTSDLGTTATTVYRRVLMETTSGAIAMDAKIALRPCATLTACLSDRAAFDQDWTTMFKAAAPATAKDGRTWLTVGTGTPYTLTMTHAFTTTNGQSWLVGVSVAAVPGEEPAAQRVLNDIWRQTQ